MISTILEVDIYWLAWIAMMIQEWLSVLWKVCPLRRLTAFFRRWLAITIRYHRIICPERALKRWMENRYLLFGVLQASIDHILSPRM